MTNGTVRVRGLNLRDSLRPGNVVKTLRKNSPVDILGEETWLRVRTRDGQEGYVFGDFVERDAPTASTMSVLSAGPSGECVLERSHHERFVGSPLIADIDFFAALDRVAGFAVETGLLVHVTSSTRDPAAMSRGP